MNYVLFNGQDLLTVKIRMHSIKKESKTTQLLTNLKLMQS
jgi:hypothetical protein